MNQCAKTIINYDNALDSNHFQYNNNVTGTGCFPDLGNQLEDLSSNGTEVTEISWDEYDNVGWKPAGSVASDRISTFKRNCNGAMKSERRKAEWCHWGTAARGLNLEAECYGLTHTSCHNEQGQWPITITFFFFFSDFKFHACSVNLFSSGIRSDEWFRCVHENSVQTGKWKNTIKYCTLYLKFNSTGKFFLQMI